MGQLKRCLKPQIAFYVDVSYILIITIIALRWSVWCSQTYSWKPYRIIFGIYGVLNTYHHFLNIKNYINVKIRSYHLLVILTRNLDTNAYLKAFMTSLLLKMAQLEEQSYLQEKRKKNSWTSNKQTIQQNIVMNSLYLQKIKTFDNDLKEKLQF